jgi:glycosyltransferase involved in cell wall biosynthesis
MPSKKPSILIVAPYGFNDRLTNFVEFVIGRLLARNGWHVTALKRKEKGETHRETVADIDVIRYTTPLHSALLLLNILRSRPNVIHIFGMRNNQIACLATMLAKLLRIHVFFTEYGLPHDHYLSQDRDDPFSTPLEYKNVVSSLTGLCLRIVHRPLRSTESIRNYLFHYPLFHANEVIFVSKHNLSIAPKLGLRTFRYIPYLLDTERWNIAHSSADAPKLPAGIKTLFVGQLKERKGWETYLQAIPHVANDVVATFMLVTPSPDTSEYERVAQKLGVADRVHLFEKVPGDILQSLFAAADIVVVPSLYEGFGLVPLEAFEAHTPVIATRVEALTDFLDETCALLIPPRDPRALAKAIETLARDPHLRRTLATGGDAVLAAMRSRERHEEWINLYRPFLRSS